MKRKRVFKSLQPGVGMAAGISNDGKLGLAITNGGEAKAFIFNGEEQIDAFLQFLMELKFEAEMGEYELTPVEKLIRIDDDEDYI